MADDLSLDEFSIADPSGSRSDETAVRRSVDLDLPADEAWHLVRDDDERSAWFGGPSRIDPVPGGAGRFTDPDGTERHAAIETVEPGRRLAWTWWPADDDADTSRVEIDLAPIPGGTRVTVVEVPVTPAARPATGTAFALAA